MCDGGGGGGAGLGYLVGPHSCAAAEAGAGRGDGWGWWWGGIIIALQAIMNSLLFTALASLLSSQRAKRRPGRPKQQGGEDEGATARRWVWNRDSSSERCRAAARGEG